MKNSMRLIAVIMALALILPAMIGCTSSSPAPAAKPAAPATSAAPAPAPTAKPPTAPPPAQKQIILKQAGFSAPTHVLTVHGGQWFADRVAELSKGAMKIEYYPAEALVKAAGMWDATTSGLVNIGEISVGYAQERIPAAAIYELPGAFNDIQSAYGGLATLFTGVLSDSFKKFGLVPFNISTGGMIRLISKKQINVLEDLKGVKIRTTAGVQAKALETLGGTPISMAATDVYIALDRGTIDGSTASLATFESFKYYEVAKFITMAPIGNSGSIISMNAESWNKLSPENQKIIAQAFIDGQNHLVQSINEAEAASVAKMKAAGTKVTDMSADEVKRWVDKLQPLWEGYVKSNGPLGQQVVDAYKKLGTK